MTKDLSRQLTPKEEEIMAIFWRYGEMFVREAIDHMPAPKPHFNTVSTYVRSLENKGWLTHEQYGNSYKYRPAVAVEEYRDKSLNGVMERFFGHSYLSLVSSLVKSEKISTDELRQLIEMVENREKKRKEE